jgi:hypothetical protein
MMNTATMRTIWALIVLLALGISAQAARTEGGRTVHRSADFGWKANQDVTEAFTRLLQDGTLKAGEELVLDHTYRINIQSRNPRRLPANFTLSAVKGAGFDVHGFSPESNPRNPVLELGERNTLRNLTITCVDAPPPGPTGGKRGVNFFKGVGISAEDKNDLLFENCRFTGSIGHTFKLSNCSRIKFLGCHIVGGYWSLRLVGVSDAVLWRCLIEKCQGDGIKTGPGKKKARRFLVENCVFPDNGRDGIDTTGGFSDSVVRNTVFRRLKVSGLDIKSVASRTRPPEQNTNIRIENCLFHDTPNAIVLTVGDQERRRKQGDFLTPENIKAYAPHDIEIVNCVVGHAEKPLKPSNEGGYGVNYPEKDEYMRLVLLKDAYDVRYRNIRLSGERIVPYVISSAADSKYGSRFLSPEAARSFEHTITGNVLPDPAPPIEPGVTDVPFACGPQDME